MDEHLSTFHLDEVQADMYFTKSSANQVGTRFFMDSLHKSGNYDVKMIHKSDKLHLF